MKNTDIAKSLAECFILAFPHRKLPEFSATFASQGITSLEIAYLMYQVERKFDLDLLDLSLHELDTLAAYQDRIENVVKK